MRPPVAVFFIIVSMMAVLLNFGAGVPRDSDESQIAEFAYLFLASDE